MSLRDRKARLQWQKEYRERKPKIICPRCNKKMMNWRSAICWMCHLGRGRKYRIKHSAGYAQVYEPNNARADCRGYMYEHLLMAERALGRPLKRGEVIHHINGIKNDNRNKNFLICANSYHSWLEAKMSDMYKQEHFGGI